MSLKITNHSQIHKMMKPNYANYILGILLFLGPFLNAQSPVKSPITIGIDIHTHLNNLDCDNCFFKEVLNPEKVNLSFNQYNMSFNYRFIRWLGLTSNFAYYQVQTRDDLIGFNSAKSNSFPVMITNRAEAFSASIGPQFLLRIEQSEVYFEGRWGVIIANNNIEGHAFEEGAFSQRSTDSNLNFTAYRIGCTTWPKARFGINMGLEAIIMRTTLFSNNFSISKPDLISPLTIEQRPLNFWNFSVFLGAYYRFN